MSTIPETLTTASPISGTLDGTLPPSSPSGLAMVPVSASTPPVKPKTLRSITRRRIPKAKAPKDSRVYKAAMATIALRAQGMKYDDIATQLGLTKLTIQTYLKRANRKGWLNLENFDDPEDQLEHVLKTKVTRNINTVLEETGDDGSLTNRAVEVTMEVAKGTGLLKQHQVVKSEGTTSVGVALKVQVEMPPNAVTPTVRAGSIGGTPAYDAEIIATQE